MAATLLLVIPPLSQAGAVDGSVAILVASQQADGGWMSAEARRSHRTMGTLRLLGVRPMPNSNSGWDFE
ncbi:MAG: hypothetical protein ACE5HV_16270 [Acidobacteriota bacterium]